MALSNYPRSPVAEVSLSSAMTSKLDSQVTVLRKTGCFLWNGERQLTIHGKRVEVRRLVFEGFVGTVSRGQYLFNTCRFGELGAQRDKLVDKKAICINPAHLVLSTSWRKFTPTTQPCVADLAASSSVPRVLPLTDEGLAEARKRSYEQLAQQLAWIDEDEQRERAGLKPLHRGRIDRELFRPITLTTTADGAVFAQVPAFSPRFLASGGRTDAMVCDGD